jgi:acetyl esterase/lipase
MKKIMAVLAFINFLFLNHGALESAYVISSIGPDDPLVIPLWKNGAPGFENRRSEPEEAKDYWVRNIHNPSLTAYFPRAGTANGTAVIICPGGGHNKLVITAEGKEAADYFTSNGVTAFVLKYRLFREENSPYSEANARQDGLRAMRMVRSLAKDFNLDADRIGIMGFSAGGELAAWTSFAKGQGDSQSDDPIEKVDAHPDFQILIYPGPLAVETSIAGVPPPAFMLAANDDRCCSGPILDLARKYREANVPVEIHLYAQGDHAFNMGKRSSLNSIKTWSDRLTDWLSDNGWIKKNKS